MRTDVLVSLRALAVFTLVTGLVFPAVITLVAQTFFPHQAGGSLILKDGEPIGSELIGQANVAQDAFWPRPSGTSPEYNAASSGGTNWSAMNPKLLERTDDLIARYKAVDPGNTSPIPIDLVTASGSGLDPHISAAAAAYQLPRVARERGLSIEQVRSLVDEHTESPWLGFIGEAGVNVVTLNGALDHLTTTP